MGNDEYNYTAVSATEHGDGTVTLSLTTFDQASRRVAPQTIMKLVQPDEGPLSPLELLLVGVAEELARRSGLEFPLPF